MRRYGQLKREARRHLPAPFTVVAFVDWLTSTKRPHLLPNSWNQVRTASAFGLRHDPQAAKMAGTLLDATIARLVATPADPPKNSVANTSHGKAKRFAPGDLDRICHAALGSRSPNGATLADCLRATTITGLRECEWPAAKLRRATVAGFEWELIVQSGKATNGRSHGETRTLRWPTMTIEELHVIQRWLSHAKQTANAGRYDRLMSTLRDLMHDICKSLFKRRNSLPTLYTARHEAAARWKAFYAHRELSKEERLTGLAMVAALLGHASDETATRHYGRPKRGEEGGSFSIPAPDPAEVARVRQRFGKRLARIPKSTSSRIDTSQLDDSPNPSLNSFGPMTSRD